MNRLARLAALVPFAPFAVAVLAVPAVAVAGEPSPAKPMNVKRLVFAHGVDRHEPQDTTSTFAAKDDRVYAFIEVENPGGDGSVNVVFEPPTGPAFTVPLKVGAASPRFRTWAFTRRAHEAGEWTVVVRDGHHKVLAKQSFTVTK